MEQTGQNATNSNRQAYQSPFPPGYRFDPEDRELILHYLIPKIHGKNLPVDRIHEINIYEHDPSYLTETNPPLGDNIWYFFTSRKKKYKNGNRPDRKAGNGFWKATGADTTIYNADGERIGYRKALVWYRGKPTEGKKTHWVMYEYRIDTPLEANEPATLADEADDDDGMRLDNYVLCRIQQKENRSVRNRPRAKKGVSINDRVPKVEEEDKVEDEGEHERQVESNILVSNRVPINIRSLRDYPNNNTYYSNVNVGSSLRDYSQQYALAHQVAYPYHDTNSSLTDNNQQCNFIVGSSADNGSMYTSQPTFSGHNMPSPFVFGNNGTSSNYHQHVQGRILPLESTYPAGLIDFEPFPGPTEYDPSPGPTEYDPSPGPTEYEPFPGLIESKPFTGPTDSKPYPGPTDYILAKREFGRDP